jgi:hypothetical protein
MNGKTGQREFYFSAAGIPSGSRLNVNTYQPPPTRGVNRDSGTASANGG